MKQFCNVKKLPLLFLVCCIFVFASCKNPVEEYGDTVIKTYKGTQQFGNEITLTQLQESIKAFNAAHSRYPKDLEEISDFTGLTLGDGKYDYDPSTGVIKLKK
jgi:hypothetical protein